MIRNVIFASLKVEKDEKKKGKERKEGKKRKEGRNEGKKEGRKEENGGRGHESNMQVMSRICNRQRNRFIP